MGRKLFVYGTLRQGMINYTKYLKGHVRKITPAFIKGEMFMLKSGKFPAVIEGTEFIHGEIIELKKNSASIIKQVDKMEGFHVDDSPDNLYDKELYPIYNQQGKKIDQLEIYLYNIARNPKLKDTLGEKISSNDFVEYCKKNKLKRFTSK